ncbi:MAG: polyprenyl synthetase family protein [Acidobacteriota bacterium]
MPLHELLTALRSEIESALAGYALKPPATPGIVGEAMQYSLTAGGKRLRPLLTLCAADAVAARGGLAPDLVRRLAMPSACAIEMIHTYSLIHDDLPAMDDDTLRRGRPTLHVVAGDGMAILAGDGLQADAFRLLAREPSSNDPAIVSRKLRVIATIAEAAGSSGMVGGQALDLAAIRPAPGRPPAILDAAGLEAMHGRKTGALIRAATVAGAIMAGADEEAVAALDRFGVEIGLAFQIVDDLLDVEQRSETLGKTAGKDAQAGKPTYPSLFGLERSRQLAADRIASAASALTGAGLDDSALMGIARWVLDRQS